MKVRIFKEAYQAKSGAYVNSHWIEFNSNDVEIIIENEEVKLLGTKWYPYNWNVPVTGELKFISVYKNK